MTRLSEALERAHVAPTYEPESPDMPQSIAAALEDVDRDRKDPDSVSRVWRFDSDGRDDPGDDRIQHRTLFVGMYPESSYIGHYRRPGRPSLARSG